MIAPKLELENITDRFCWVGVLIFVGISIFINVMSNYIIHKILQNKKEDSK